MVEMFDCEKRSWESSHLNWKKRHIDLLDEKDMEDLENEAKIYTTLKRFKNS